MSIATLWLILGTGHARPLQSGGSGSDAVSSSGQPGKPLSVSVSVKGYLHVTKAIITESLPSIRQTAEDYVSI